MGYHFVIDSVTLPTKIAGGKFVIELCVENVGVAPVYNKIPLKVRLKGDKNEKVCVTDIDITKWLPGKHAENISLDIANDLPLGRYKVEIGIFDDLSRVYFATDAESDGEYYTLATLLKE